MDPVVSSWWFVCAEPIVYAYSACSSVLASEGRNGSESSTYGSVRVTATCMISSGSGDDTGQSEPSATRPPARRIEPNGYCQAARSEPRYGMVSSVICGSLHAHKAC